MWRVLTVDGLHWVCHSLRQCVLPGSTLLILQGALQGHCPKWNLHFVYFPGLSTQVLGCSIRRQTWMGCVFHALPRTKQLMRPGAWQEHCARRAICLIHLSIPVMERGEYEQDLVVKYFRQYTPENVSESPTGSSRLKITSEGNLTLYRNGKALLLPPLLSHQLQVTLKIA